MLCRKINFEAFRILACVFERSEIQTSLKLWCCAGRLLAKEKDDWSILKICRRYMILIFNRKSMNMTASIHHCFGHF